MTGSRIQRFREVEEAALKPLPNAAFEPCQWKRAIRVNADYHVEHGGVFYSVPYHLIGKKVDTRFTEKTLEIFESGKRVAFHALELTSVAMVTLQEHRPIAHQRVLDAEPKALLEWAKTVGANTHAIHAEASRRKADAGYVMVVRVMVCQRVQCFQHLDHHCSQRDHWKLSI